MAVDAMRRGRKKEGGGEYKGERAFERGCKNFSKDSPTQKLVHLDGRERDIPRSPQQLSSFGSLPKG